MPYETDPLGVQRLPADPMNGLLGLLAGGGDVPSRWRGEAQAPNKMRAPNFLTKGARGGAGQGNQRLDFDPQAWRHDLGDEIPPPPPPGVIGDPNLGPVGTRPAAHAPDPGSGGGPAAGTGVTGPGVVGGPTGGEGGGLASLVNPNGPGVRKRARMGETPPAPVNTRWEGLKQQQGFGTPRWDTFKAAQLRNPANSSWQNFKEKFQAGP